MDPFSPIEMASFYQAIVSQVPRLFWENIQTYQGATAAFLSFAAIVNRPVAECLMKRSGISGWWSLVPIAALTVWSVLEANYLDREELRVAAVEAINESIGPREYSIPLDIELEREIHEALIAIEPGDLQIRVHCLGQTNGSTQVCRQVRKFLFDARLANPTDSHLDGFGVGGGTSVPPVSLSFSGDDYPWLRPILMALDDYLRVNIIIDSASGTPGEVEIRISGDPVFFGDGTVAFK
jgi:hypothetical protein